MPIKNAASYSVNRLRPTIDKLAQTGHTLLAIKLIIFATRTDLLLIRKRAAVKKFDRKLIKLHEETYVIERQISTALYTSD